MSMINTRDIMETINMISAENLDVRTVTMGISLLDCADPDPKRACEKIYNKISTRAARLVPVWLRKFFAWLPLFFKKNFLCRFQKTKKRPLHLFSRRSERKK